MNKITTLFYSESLKHLDSYTYNQTKCTIENIVDKTLQYVKT